MLKEYVVTIEELLGEEVDIDIYDDYDERIGIAFCGPVELTREGEAYFKDILKRKKALRK